MHIPHHQHLLLLATGAARNKVSKAGQSKPSPAYGPVAAKNNRVVPGLAQQAGELFQMAGPVGEDQAVAVLAECGEGVCDDLPCALLISDQVSADGRHTARAGRVGVAVVPVRSRVNVQHRGGPAGDYKRVLAGCVAVKCDGVPAWSYLHGDQIVELVAAVRGGGEPEPAPCWDLREASLAPFVPSPCAMCTTTAFTSDGVRFRRLQLIARGGPGRWGSRGGNTRRS
jgi:hypothetical protein